MKRKTKWKPDIDCPYFYVDDAGVVRWSYYDGVKEDMVRIEAQNCFQSGDIAEKCAREVRKVFKKHGGVG